MQTWDRNIQDIKFKQKLNSVKSTLPKISYSSNSNNYPSINKKKNTFSNPQNLNNLEMLYINSTKINSQNNIPNINHQQNKKEMKKQNYLKHLLSEFGLSQYFRKLYELGYDDKNVNKIGLLTRKSFQELIQNMHIYPGQTVKMEKLYDYLRQLNLTKNLTGTAYLNNINKTSSNTLPKKPVSGNINKRKLNNNTIYNFNSNLNYLCNNNNYKQNGNMHKTYVSPNHSNNKYSLEMERPKTSIIKAKSKPKPIGNKGYNNYQCEINNNYINMKNDVNNGHYFSNKNLNCVDENNYNYNYSSNNELEKNENKMLNWYKKGDFNDNYFKGKEVNKVCCPSINNNIATEQYEEKVTKNIDKMLKYYMVQLNEKLDKSYGSVEDSSLSYNVTLPFNDKSTSNICETQTNDNKENKLPSINNIKAENKKEKENTTINKKPRPKSKYGNNIIVKSQRSSEKKETISNKNVNEKENEKEIKNDNNNNKLKEMAKEEKNKKNENIQKENKEIDNKPKQEEEQKPQQEIEEIIEEPKPIDNKINNNNANNNQINANKKIDPNNTIEENDNNIFSTEQNIYENLRLNKSFQKDYLNQNTDQFDIEYMCKCLGLALMKLLESGKGKSHITDLIQNKIKFLFFNSVYNKNFEILSDFFNLENKKEIETISNLEKLNTILQNDEDNQEINILKHVSKPDDKNLIEEEIRIGKLKLKGGLTEIEKDIKFIDEFFSMGKNRVRNYNGLSEKSKNIMCKDLSYINEVDSEVNTTKNKNNSNANINSSNQEEFKIPEENLEQEEDTVNTVDLNDKKELENNSNNNIKEKNDEKKEEKKEEKNENIKKEEISQNNKNEKIDENNKNNDANLSMESDYIIDINTKDQLKIYLLKQMEIFDDDFIYSAMHIPARKYVPPPDPQCIFEFCANIMILTKMEKEIIIIALIYIERLIFNTGLLLTNRNWRRLIFTVMVVASKIWDDDSFENNHFGQVFTHLSIGEINLLERTFLELIDYKVYVKCSEYLKYFFIIKSIALKYNYNGVELVPISVERMMKIQEYAFQMQKRLRKKKSLNNSAHF